MTVFGQLRIVPSANMAGLGPHEGQPSVYQWHWYYSARGLLPWLVLVVAAVSIKANRNCRTLLILLPLAVVSLAYLLFRMVMSSSSAMQFDLLFYPLAIGITLLWLAAPVLGRYRSIMRLLMALALMMGVAALGLVSSGTESSEATTLLLTILAFLGAVAILAPVGAARLSGRSVHPVVFMLWLAVWMVVGSSIATLGTLGVAMSVLSWGLSMSELLRLVPQLITFAAILGVSLYLLYLPYMLLGFVSPFFRTRLRTCLNMEGPATSDGG